jgi:anti-sigma28 factor (negative regulator of flagellin synthesis)
MRIDDRVSNYMSILLGDAAKPASKAKGNADSAAVPGTSTDKVTISPVAVQLNDDDNARRERLFAIQRRLSEGTYNISGKDVANKIINILKS